MTGVNLVGPPVPDQASHRHSLARVHTGPNGYTYGLGSDVPWKCYIPAQDGGRADEGLATCGSPLDFT